MKKGFVYIMSNKNRTVFYTGVTNDIVRRTSQHKIGEGSVFTKKYNLKDLLYFEEFQTIQEAILREKQIKNWKREWKLNIIKEKNPEFRDLSEDF